VIDVQTQDITPNYFLVEANRYIYSAIEYLFMKRQAPTPFAIIEVLQNKHAKQVIEDFGGIEYLTTLAESNINEDTLDIFCQKLKQAYTRHQLYKICDLTQDFIFSDKMEVMNPAEIIGEHEKKIQQLVSDMQNITDVYKMGDNIEKVLEHRAEHPNEVPGIETGWTKFDYYTNGGQPGDLIMLCARAKTGKSATLTNWATKVSIEDKVPILYIDTEMNQQEQEDRILAILSGVPHKEIVSGMFVLDTDAGKADDKIRRIKEATQKMKEGAYYHIYMPDFNMDKVTALAHKFKQQFNIQAIFFDYLKFPSSQVGSLKTVQEWQMLGYIASSLKDLAGTLKLPVYAGCQENRSDPKSDKKDERNVGGSDRILQLATKLIFLNNKSEEQIFKEGGLNGNQTLQIAYQRNGESNCPPINIQFDRTILRQREI
jgi:replicative DNA helicase